MLTWKKTLRKSQDKDISIDPCAWQLSTLASSCYWCSNVSRLNRLSAPRKRNQWSASGFPRCWPYSWARILDFIRDLVLGMVSIWVTCDHWQSYLPMNFFCVLICQSEIWSYCVPIVVKSTKIVQNNVEIPNRENIALPSCLLGVISYLILQPAWFQRIETY